MNDTCPDNMSLSSRIDVREKETRRTLHHSTRLHSRRVNRQEFWHTWKKWPFPFSLSRLLLSPPVPVPIFGILALPFQWNFNGNPMGKGNPIHVNAACVKHVRTDDAVGRKARSRGRSDDTCTVKAAFHDTDIDTDTDIIVDSPDTSTSLRRCRYAYRCRGMPP